MMDQSGSIFDVLIDSIVKNGSEGVSVKDVFDRHVPRPLHEALWSRLKTCSGDVQYFLDGEPMSLDSQELQSCESARESGVELKPSSELCDALLGIYGQNLQRFKFSDIQKQSLLLIEKAGLHGIAQNDLCKMVNRKANNFGYVMTSLEERDKIYRKKANVKTFDEAKGRSTSVSTSYVYPARLKAFINSSNSMVGIPGGSGEDVSAEYVNDEESYRKLLGELDKHPNGLAIEGTLKVDLGYKHRPGHRQWRRIREKMVHLGLISTFNGTTEDGKNESFVKKLKDLQVESQQDVSGTVAHFERPVRNFNYQFAEISLDRQNMIEIAKAGPDGATSSDLTSLLGLNTKKHSVRFSELESRASKADVDVLSLKIEKITVQRSSQNLFTASQRLAENILDATQSLIGEDVVRQALQKYTTEGDAVADDQEIRADTTDITYKTEEGVALNKMFTNRLHWLVDAVNSKGYLLSMHASGLLLDKEEKVRGRGEVAKSLDKKTILRLAKVAQQNKLLTIATASVPSKSGSGGSLSITVFLPYQAPMTDAIFEKILNELAENSKTKAAKNASNNGDGVNKPLVAGTFKKHENMRKRSFQIYKVQQDNGYHCSKLHRCQVVLEAICSMIQSRPKSYASEMLEDLLSTGQDSEIRVIHEIPEKEIRDDHGDVTTRSQDIFLFEATEDTKRNVFTRDELWRALSVEDFLQALGSVCEDQEFLASIKGKMLSDLSEMEIVHLAGDNRSKQATEKHFSNVLRMLVNLGLLKSIVSVGKLDGLQQHNQVALKKDAMYYILSDFAAHEINRPCSTIKSASATLNSDNGRTLVLFDLQDANQRRGYWISLQYLFATLPRQPLDSVEPNVSGSPNGKPVFPADRVYIDRSIGRMSYKAEDLEHARLEILNDIDIENSWIDWRQIDELSVRLGTSVELIIRVLSELRSSKSRRGMPSRKSKGPRRGRQKSKRNMDASELSQPEEEEVELVLLEPETVLPSSMRKRKWSESEDRALLISWIQWIAMSGSKCKIMWKSLKNLPAQVKRSSCQNRISKLLSDDCVKEYMISIREAADEVYQRRLEMKLSKKRKSAEQQKGSNIFPINCDEDLKAARSITANLERVIQGAPERPAEGADVSSARLEKLAKSYPHEASPSEFLPWLKSYVMKTKALSETRHIPSLEETAAITSVLSYLYDLEFMGKSPEGIDSVISSRFNAETLTRAVKFLVSNDLIVAKDSEADGKVVFQLSSRFKEEIKPPFSPLVLSEDNYSLFNRSETHLWPLPQHSHPISLSPLLSVAIMGQAHFKVSIPGYISEAFSSFESNPDAPSKYGHHCLERNMAFLSIQDLAEAKACLELIEKPQVLVRYQPQELLDSSEIKKEAESAFLDVTANQLGANVGNSILQIVTKAGRSGVASSTLYSLLQSNKVNAQPGVIENLLQEYGLARIIQGFNETYIVSSFASESLVHEKARDAVAMNIDSADMDKSCQEASKPLCDTPLRPWIDGHGKLIKPLWQSFVARVVDVVSRFPGINGKLLIEVLRVLPPQLAKELVQILCHNEVLYFKKDPHPQDDKLKMEQGVFSTDFSYSVKPVENAEAEQVPFSSGPDSSYCFFIHASKALHFLKCVPPY